MSARASLNGAALAGRSCLASKFTLITLSAGAAILFFYSVRPARLPGDSEASQFELPSEETLDQSLYQAATSALGSRSGTIIAMDPQTGRIRAVVNPQLASEAAFAPGSTIKPFTLLAALRVGIIQKNSLILCREHYSHEGFATTCSHPRDLPPFNPTEAIAYSCNYFFGKVGEQLDGSAFNSTLMDFGFGERVGIDWLERTRAAAGRLPQDWLPQNALGEGSQIQVSPIQLLTAYSALVNGGYLFEPHVGQARDFVPKFRRKIYVDSEQRSLIKEGMRGAVRYGTAERAGLYSLPAYIFGKTGTSTETGGFRTQGWFVGFAAGSDDPNQLPAEPESARLAVLIFLKRAHGAEAAALARPIFEAYVEGRRGDGRTGQPGGGGFGGMGKSP
jgi:penicillin-binding protein A